jgi:glycerol-3-phosphate cytidylyltransferase
MKRLIPPSPQVRGVIAGNFDVIHPGYVRFFRDAKENACEWLIIALQGDPTIERPHKAKPILSLEERTEILMALRDIDEVVYYNTEAELLELLQELRPHVRILGSDYRNKEFTGCDLAIPVYYHQRNHDWSTTRFKNEIAEQSRRQQATQPSNVRTNPPVC